MKLNRRDFIQNTLLGLGGAAVLGVGGRRLINYANAENRSERKALINIVIWGGWNSAFFHSAVKRDELARHLSGSLGNQIAVSDSIFGLSDIEFQKKYKYSSIHADSYGANYSYQGRSHYFGNLWNQSFDSEMMKKILVWKGLYQEGQHGIGNGVLVNGQASPYAKSFSALVSAHIASQHYVRPLHYVSIAQKPGDLYANMAMNTGFEIPISIPNAAQFNALTATNNNDIADLSRRQLLEKAISDLAGTIFTSNFKRRSSQAAVNTFSQSFWGATQVANSDISKSVEFLHLRLRMYHAMAEAMDEFVRSPTWGGSDGRIAATDTSSSPGSAFFSQVSGFYQTIKGYAIPAIEMYLLYKQDYQRNPGSTDKKALYLNEQTRLRNSLTTTLAALDNRYAGGPLFAQRSFLHSFNFALAAYLVREDLSAVVDLPAWGGDDTHGGGLNHQRGCIDTFLSFRAYRTLIKMLEEVHTPDGKTILDQTTLVMHTELDRELWMQTADTIRYNGNGIGTNHGLATSVIMAGYGVNTGAIIGDIHKGPSDLARFPESAGYEYISPLPIDPNTGVPKPLSEGGEKVSTKTLLLTILDIFGVTVPAQQVTEAAVTRAARKA